MAVTGHYRRYMYVNMRMLCQIMEYEVRAGDHSDRACLAALRHPDGNGGGA